MMEMQTTQINLYECIHEIMWDKDAMDLFLKSLVNSINMTLIPETMMGRKNPHSILYSPAHLPVEDHGVTGIAVMSESHISAHSFPNKGGFINIVITSCKSFDSKGVLLWILKYTKTSVYKAQSMCF